MPLVFANSHRSFSSKVVLAIGLTIFYVFIDWWLHRTPPLIEVDPGALAALRYFNIGCYLLALGVIAAAHGQTVGHAERRLNMLASTDTLTGLLNRRRMSDQMQKELVQARASQGSLCVLLLDIDNFKSINDEFGHARGDQVIVAAGEILRANVRQQDLIARWGGEEFLIAAAECRSHCGAGNCRASAKCGVAILGSRRTGRRACHSHHWRRQRYTMARGSKKLSIVQTKRFMPARGRGVIGSS